MDGNDVVAVWNATREALHRHAGLQAYAVLPPAETLRATVLGAAALLAAEVTNLENGESDLFKINVQQEKLFNAHSKLIKVMADYEKQKALLYWSAGVGMDRVK